MHTCVYMYRFIYTHTCTHTFRLLYSSLDTVFMPLTPNCFWGFQAFTIGQRQETTVFPTTWISVQIANSANANISKTFISYYKLQGFSLNPPLTGQINSR